MKLVSTTVAELSKREPRTPYEALKFHLEKSKIEFLPVMGNSQQNVDKFMRVVLNAALANPDIQHATAGSVMAACMKAAQDGLLPDGREAAINTYSTNVAGKNEKPCYALVAQYLPMVGGMVKKLYESGEITSIDAACVFAGDKFKYRRGDDPSIEHEPTDADDPGPIIAVYAVIKLKSGETKREVMFKRDIEAVRQTSKMKDKGPWKDWYDQKAIAAVIKRAYKQLPKVEAFERVADSDNQEYIAITTAASKIEREPVKKEQTSEASVPDVPISDTDTSDNAKTQVSTVDTETGEIIEPPKFEITYNYNHPSPPIEPGDFGTLTVDKPSELVGQQKKQRNLGQYMTAVSAAESKQAAETTMTEARGVLAPADFVKLSQHHLKVWK